MNILWFGPIIKDEQVSKGNQQSPASNVWELQQISALSKLGNNIKVYSFIPLRSYPNGVLISQNDEYKNQIICDNTTVTQFSYINIRYLREVTIGVVKLVSLFFSRDYKKFDIALFYNNSLNHRMISIFLKFFTNIKCVEIIADDEDSSLFDAHIYLSYGYYKSSQYSNKKKYFFDQPTFLLKDSTDDVTISNKVKRLTYAGALSKYGGITEFVKIFIKILNTTDKLNNLELHIVGHGTPDSLLIELCKHKNIVFHGFVSIEKLQEILSLSDFFVNPRPAIDGNEKNFPSKLITYMQYGKPIISSHTEGLSPKYKEVLTFFDSDLDESIKSSLLYLTSLSQEDFQKHRENISSFTTENSINKMIKGFNDFIEHLVGEKKGLENA